MSSRVKRSAIPPRQSDFVFNAEEAEAAEKDLCEPLRLCDLCVNT